MATVPGTQKKVILHFNDWNFQDKYYETPISVLKEFRDRFFEARKKQSEKDAMSDVWQWWTTQIRYDEKDEGKPVLFGRVDMTLEEFFISWIEPEEGFREIP
jgi:hypothetical protein